MTLDEVCIADRSDRRRRGGPNAPRSLRVGLHVQLLRAAIGGEHAVEAGLVAGWEGDRLWDVGVALENPARRYDRLRIDGGRNLRFGACLVARRALHRLHR